MMIFCECLHETHSHCITIKVNTMSNQERREYIEHQLDFKKMFTPITQMPQHMENAIAEQMSNQQKADLWKINPLSKLVVSK